MNEKIVIEYIIKSFLLKFNINLNVVYGDTEFCYVDETETIYVCNMVDDETDKIFEKVCLELGLENNCPLFILSILHEVGHYVDFNITHQSSVDDFDLLETFVALTGLLRVPTDDDVYTYMTSYREKVATQWAVDFANEHYEECIDLWNKIVKILKG